MLEYTILQWFIVYTVVNTCIAYPQFIDNDGTFIAFAFASIVMILLCNIILPEAMRIKQKENYFHSNFSFPDDGKMELSDSVF